MTRHLLKLSAFIALATFLLLTGWGITVTGVLESPAYGVAHFEAGAGNRLLLVRVATALTASALLVALAFVVRTRLHRLLIVSVALLVPVLFVWSCLGLERWAPGYSENAFNALSTQFRKGIPVKQPQVLSALGPPLYSATLPNAEFWSYTYMPSGGFGWHKRVLLLQHGVVSNINAMNEP